MYAGQENVTGESLPILKQPGSVTYSGGQVLDGVLVIRTSAAAADSTASRIACVTAEALKQRAPVTTALARLTKRWSEVVILGTAVAFAGLLAMGVPLWGGKGAVYRALGLLTAAAPCALLLVSLAFVCAVAVLSRHGIIVKGAHLFDVLERVTFVALDKTGTISRGQLTCTDVRAVWGGSDTDLDPVQVAAALSFRGRHPVCSAVLEYLAATQSGAVHSSAMALRRSAGTDGVLAVQHFTAQAGAGMSGHLGKTAAAFGSVAYVAPLLSDEQAQALTVAVQRSGGNAVYSVLVQGAPATGNSNSNGNSGATSPATACHVTLFGFSDQPKEDSKGVILRLRSMGLGVGIYTGDNDRSALAIGKQIGMAPFEVHANLSPECKASLVSDLQRDGHCVLMVGDGINDAPAMAQADVSVALAEDMESATAGVAGVVLLQSSTGAEGGRVPSASILRIAFLLCTARVVRTVVAQNLAIAFCSMIIGAVPVLGGFVPLWVAVLVHEGSTVAVALNSCRLLLLKQPQIKTSC
jgi:Zn2+/Cd2+-exporting ATPase